MTIQRGSVVGIFTFLWSDSQQSKHCAEFPGSHGCVSELENYFTIISCVARLLASFKKASCQNAPGRKKELLHRAKY